MAEIKWIKIVTDIFDDEKILLIESLPEADSIIVCWFKLLCLAGKQNNSGVLMLNDRMPYTEEMLATIFRRPLQTVRLALETFEAFGMIEIINGTITIPNWGKHQQIEEINKIREQTRDRVSKYRERQKQLSSSNVTCNVTVTGCNATEEDKNRLEEDKNRLEEDKNREEEVLAFSNEKACACRKDMHRAVEAWNTLGLAKVSKIVTGSQRDIMLKKRLSEYGIDEFLRAIENVRSSKFLMGDNKKNWQITFDWFIRPNNFPKVLDGNYADKNETVETNNPFLRMIMEGKV